MTTTHRPLLMRRPIGQHSVHCTCGLYCGSTITSWKQHKADRSVLDQAAVFIDMPITEELHRIRESMQRSIDHISAAFRNIKKQLEPMAHTVARIQPMLPRDRYTTTRKDDQ